MKSKSAANAAGTPTGSPPNGAAEPGVAAAGDAAKRGRRGIPRPLDAHDHDIVTTAAGSGRLKIFVDLVRAAGLTELLQGAGPFTVFAPTDRAFDRIPERDLDALMADSSRLAKVLGHHVVSGRVKAPQPERPGVATPMEGVDLMLTSRVDAYYVNEARLVRTNIRASNGVIHAIDKLLVLA